MATITYEGRVIAVPSATSKARRELIGRLHNLPPVITYKARRILIGRQTTVASTEQHNTFFWR